MNTSRGVKLPAGAGRTFHMIYPQVGQSRTTAGAIGTTGTFRPGPTQTAVVSAGVRGTGSQSFSGAVQGAAPVTLAAPVATDASNIKFTSTSFYPILEQLASNPVGNPAQVYRFLVMAAFPLLPGNIGASSDLGLVLVTANNSFVTDGVHPGVTFGPVGANAIGLRAYKTGANTFTRDLAPAAVAAGLDYTKFNLWELRLTNATATAPAQLKAFVNGTQFGAAVDCSAAAGLFPLISAGGGGFLGFAWGFNNTNPGAAAPYSCHFTDAHVIISATEDDAG